MDIVAYVAQVSTLGGKFAGTVSNGFDGSYPSLLWFAFWGQMPTRRGSLSIAHTTLRHVQIHKLASFDLNSPWE